MIHPFILFKSSVTHIHWRNFLCIAIPDLFTLGVAHDDLKAFLENNIPTGKKRSKVALGVGDSKIGGSIQNIDFLSLILLLSRLEQEHRVMRNKF